MDDPIKKPMPGYVYQNTVSGNIFMIIEDGGEDKGVWLECKGLKNTVASYTVKDLMFGTYRIRDGAEKVRFICDMSQVMALVRAQLPPGSEEQ